MTMKQLKPLLCTLVLAGMATTVNAAPIVDRGLPDTNLNNAAGSDRSNVAWGFGGDFTSGDTFTLPTLSAGSTAWRIDTLRVWTTGGSPGQFLGQGFSEVSLFLGSTADSTVPRVANAGIISGTNNTDNSDVQITSVQYPGTELDYQRGGGNPAQIFQIDFSNLGLFAAGNFYFGVNGVARFDNLNWFNHASNAALSGTPQDGSDGLYNYYFGSAPDAFITFGGSFDNPTDGGWDKGSDINIQVFATEVRAQVPLPPTILLFIAGLAGLLISRRSSMHGLQASPAHSRHAGQTCRIGPG